MPDEILEIKHITVNPNRTVSLSSVFSILTVTVEMYYIHYY